jgi:two-component system alkaline phosphatase synthesis response regulator PhoP
LPGRNALELCRNIRADGIEAPILLLMDHGAIEQTVIALKLGADAYLTKPFDVEELLARMEALLQRTPTGQDHVRHFGKVRVDLRSARVTCNGVPIRLTSREFQLLSYFIKNSGIALSREQILRDVWGYGAVAKTRTVDVHVASLRQKLEVDPRRPTLIRTATRIGYMFDIAE